jgi:hypothetical protein
MSSHSFVTFLLGGLFAAGAAAQVGSSICPHQVTREIPGTSEVIGVHQCGAGISGHIGGVRINLDTLVCPTLLVVTGARNEPVTQPGSNTYVEQSGTAESRAFVYQCTPHKLLFIPLADTCDFVRSYVIATLPVYSVRPCARVE